MTSSTLVLIDARGDVIITNNKIKGEEKELVGHNRQSRHNK